ncbi:type IV toxin-antitoxin system AbiEi family antitoxin domain-containing protein [Microbacterium algeriense]|uniref:type IV toxin-antitoxin system AbiEi family antitoxin domain-containing protein n=1 Tax=Microbacterium algeriense TaxID=2615184 RepID=UPI0035582135
MLSATDTIRSLGGLARGTHLRSLGFTRQALAGMVRRGEIERVRHGVFAAGPLDEQVRAATAHGGALTCASVLRSAGIWVLPADDGPHVWLGPDNHALPHPGCTCRSHYYRGRPPLGSATIETALLHLRRCCGDEAFFAAYESAWRLKKLSAAARARIRKALPRSARWLVELASGRRQRPRIASPPAAPCPGHPPPVPSEDRRRREGRLRPRRPPDPRGGRRREPRIADAQAYRPHP